jgi:hypothetical protein
VQTPEEGIRSGRLFIDGQQVLPPYSVERDVGVSSGREQRLTFINGVLVETWTPPGGFVDPTADPGAIRAPKGARRITGNAPARIVWKFNYWTKTLGRERALELLEEFLKSYPPLKEYRFNVKRTRVKLIPYEGFAEVLELTGPDRCVWLRRKPRLRQGQTGGKDSGDKYTPALTSGATVLVFRDGPLFVVPPQSARDFQEDLDLIATPGFDRRLRIDLLRRHVPTRPEAYIFLANYQPLKSDGSQEGRRGPIGKNADSGPERRR